MACDFLHGKKPGETVVVCRGRVGRAKKCDVYGCTTAATLACDFPIGGEKTCDRTICRAHGVRQDVVAAPAPFTPVGDTRDFCPKHAGVDEPRAPERRRPMHALTIWQPWAWAILQGYKRVENRPWSPPRWLLGEWFAIHAGVRYDEPGAEKMREIGLEPPAAEKVALGAVVGVAKLARVAWEGDDLELEPADEAWFFGPCGWFLESATAIDPIPFKGHQKLWALPRLIYEQTRLRYRDAVAARGVQ